MASRATLMTDDRLDSAMLDLLAALGCLRTGQADMAERHIMAVIETLNGNGESQDAAHRIHD